MSNSLYVRDEDEYEGDHRRRGLFRTTARRDLTYKPRHLQREPSTSLPPLKFEATPRA